MGLSFEPIKERTCVLCGSSGSLIGEHKIKASLIKHEFKDAHTVIAGKDAPKLAQGPKSKAFHFKSKICKNCNSAATQSGDRAFDKLHDCLTQLYKQGSELTDSANRPECSVTQDTEIEYFRYFAKLLCCFLAEVGGPRPKQVAAFAIGRVHRNPIFLRISRDEDYKEKLISFDTDGFAKHGGPPFRFDNRKRWVQSIESSLSVGGVHYEFWLELKWISKFDLHLFFPEIIKTALAKIIPS
jgi:hypothetical protein